MLPNQLNETNIIQQAQDLGYVEYQIDILKDLIQTDCDYGWAITRKLTTDQFAILVRISRIEKAEPDFKKINKDIFLNENIDRQIWTLLRWHLYGETKITYNHGKIVLPNGDKHTVPKELWLEINKFKKAFFKRLYLKR